MSRPVGEVTGCQAVHQRYRRLGSILDSDLEKGTDGGVYWLIRQQSIDTTGGLERVDWRSLV